MKQAVAVKQPERQGLPCNTPHLPQGLYRIFDETPAGNGDRIVEDIVGKWQLQCTPLQIVNITTLLQGKIQDYGIRINSVNRQAQPGKPAAEITCPVPYIQ